MFGIKRRVVASFEEAVKKISGDYGRIDLLWPGIMLVEHKSFGEDLEKAETQAFQYIRDLARDPARHDEIPRYIIVSDFARIGWACDFGSSSTLPYGHTLPAISSNYAPMR